MMSLALHRTVFAKKDTKSRLTFVSTVPLRSQCIIHHVRERFVNHDIDIIYFRVLVDSIIFRITPARIFIAGTLSIYLL